MSQTKRLGATPNEDGSCTFLVWAPHAETVSVVLREAGEPGGDGRRERLHPQRDGYHGGKIADVAAGARYAYLINDDPLELPDPASASQPDGVHGASEVVDASAHEWGDTGWFGRPLREYVIYELHVGTFTPEGTFDAVIERLAQLREDGITAIELLPVAQFPGGRNWGYDGVDLFAPQSTYGGPEGLRRLVDAAHGEGIAVVLDVVYNHLGPEGNYLAKFGPYFSERHATIWGQGVNVDGRNSDEVRRFFIENACQWVRDYHIDALRLDAIHAIIDTSASPFLAELTDAVAATAEACNRRAHLIAESDLNDTRIITPRTAGGVGHDAQWTDDFHHALHVLLTGERSGYYADYDGLCDLARSMSQGYVYTGQRSDYRGHRFGSPSAGLPGERFVVYAQNHDQIGNRLLGDRLVENCELSQLRLAAAAVLLSPFVPMLFMGEEYGEDQPFPYFVSHGDEALVRAVRRGRKAEFAAFGFSGTAPDPQGEATFESAILQWQKRNEGTHGQLLAFTRALLQLRRTSPSIMRMRPDEMQVHVDEASQCIALERSWSGDHTIAVLNFGERPIDTSGWGVSVEEWRRVLDAADPRFGGGGAPTGLEVEPGGVAVFRHVENEQEDE